MPSASARHALRLGVLATCALLLLGVASGCSTTQETAATKQAESKRILERREQRKGDERKGRREKHD